MDLHVPKLSPCWYYWPPSTKKITLQKRQHEIVWPNDRTKWQENAIEYQNGCIPSEWKPRYRRFGVDRHTYWESGVAVEKLRRIWKFWFYLSLCENAMGCKHKLNNQHMHFHSLVPTLAGLNENLHPRVQFQELLYLIWYWRLSHHWQIYCKSTKLQRNDPLNDTQTAEESHRSLW